MAAVNFRSMAIANLHMMGGVVAKVYSTAALRKPGADGELIDEALELCCRSQVVLENLEDVIAGGYNAKLFAVWLAKDVHGRARLTPHGAALYGKPSNEIAAAVAAVEASRGWHRGSYEIHAIRSLPDPSIGRMVVFNVIADLMSRRGRAGYTVHHLWWHIAKENDGAPAIRANLQRNRWLRVPLSWLPASFKSDPDNFNIVEAVRDQRLWVLAFDDTKSRGVIAKQYALTNGSQVVSERVCNHERRGSKRRCT